MVRADAQSLNQKRRNKEAQRRKDLKKRKKKEHEEVVYIIHWSFDGPVKIGISSMLNQRLYDLQVASPYKLKVFKQFKTTSRQQSLIIENWAHERLKAFQMEGEWFSVTPEQAEQTIDTIISMIEA